MLRWNSEEVSAMDVYSAIRTAAKRSRTPLIEIGPRMGHGKAYVSALMSKGGAPRYDTLAEVLGACGYSLCAVPRGKVPKSAIEIDPPSGPLK